MTHHRLPSTSSYDPILIHTTPSNYTPPSRSSASLPSSLRLKFPYPLPLISLLDLMYTLHSSTARAHLSTGHFLLLSLGRLVVLAGIVGGSKRWRTRGGWIAVVCGMTVLGCVWEVCKDRLDVSKRQALQAADTAFLIVTALMATMEYILFLLLLRLSPPPHRLNPLSLRLPRSAIQHGTAFPYTLGQEEEEIQPPSATSTSDTIRATGHDGSSPTTSRYSHRISSSSRRHNRYPSLKTLSSGYTDASSSHMHMLGQDDDDHHHRHHDPRYEDQDGDLLRLEGDDEDDDGDGDGDGDGVDEPSDQELELDLDEDGSEASSISDSSIIDLPPAPSPARIIPPSSLSMTANLNIASALTSDGSPVFRSLVRRTSSARFFGKSWGMDAGGAEAGLGSGGPGLGAGPGPGAGLGPSSFSSPSGSSGYGTFGGRMQAESGSRTGSG